MITIELRAEPLGRGFAGSIVVEPEPLGKNRSEQGIADRLEDQPQGRFGDVMLFVSDGQAGNQRADGIKHRVQGVAVAGEDHPCGQRPGTLAAERVEGHVDNVARVALAGAGGLDGFGDAPGHAFGDGPREFRLEPCRRPKMMKQIGVGPANLGCDRFQGHCLGAMGKQQSPRRFQRDRPAFLGVEAFSTY